MVRKPAVKRAVALVLRQQHPVRFGHVVAICTSTVTAGLQDPVPQAVLGSSVAMFERVGRREYARVASRQRHSERCAGPQVLRHRAATEKEEDAAPSQAGRRDEVREVVRDPKHGQRAGRRAWVEGGAARVCVWERRGTGVSRMALTAG